MHTKQSYTVLKDVSITKDIQETSLEIKGNKQELVFEKQLIDKLGEFGGAICILYIILSLMVKPFSEHHNFLLIVEQLFFIKSKI